MIQDLLNNFLLEQSIVNYCNPYISQ